MWNIKDTFGYRDHLLSVYKYEEEGRDGNDFEIRVWEGNGLDDTGKFLEAIYIGHSDSRSAAIAIGKAFVMGIQTGKTQNGGGI